MAGRFQSWDLWKDWKGGIGLSYRLHQHIVLAIEQPRLRVLVQGLHILTGTGG